VTEHSGRDKLLAIQLGRGVAALLVVLVHGTNSLALPQYGGRLAFGNAFRFGHAGVDFFFVLSGFIISYVHHRDLGQPARFGRYVRRRLSRIYPPYWIVSALFIVSMLIFGHTERLAPVRLLTSVTLVPYSQSPILGVAWTLQHEMLFYTCFGLAVLWRPLGPALIAACLALVAAGQFVSLDAWEWRFLTTPFHLQFLMGIAAARWVIAQRVPAPRLLAALGAVAFLVAGLAENAGWITYLGFASKLAFGLSSMVLIAGLAGAERAGLIRVGGFGALIGGASYAIYLLHELVINDAAFILARAGVVRHVPLEPLLIVLAVLTVAVAIGFYLAVEQPLLRRLGRVGARQERMPLAVNG
jgi:exopolysaccharide production protein ExoZ